MHLNGGVFNLGHRNPEVIEALIKGTEFYDAGNHYFPSEVKNELYERLLAYAPSHMKYVYMNNGGGESIDSAIKFARFATKHKNHFNGRRFSRRNRIRPLRWRTRYDGIL